MNGKGPAGGAVRGCPRTAPPAWRWQMSSDQVARSSVSAGGDPCADEVDGVADGLDVGGPLLAHSDVVAVLELHDELIEVERICVQVLPEARLGLNLLRRHLELGAQVIPDQGHYLFTFHRQKYRLLISRLAKRISRGAGRRQELRGAPHGVLADRPVGEPHRVCDSLRSRAPVGDDRNAAE